MSIFRKLLANRFLNSSIRSSRPRTFVSLIEPLESRRMLAITASFIPASNMLFVRGDGFDNIIEISRDAGGAILVNGGAVTITGGTPTVANTALIQAFGLGGDDTITLNESNGALPRANLYGGAGTDVITGGSGDDRLFGQAGNDNLSGKGATDFLFGLSDNDTLTGGDADDLIFAGSGNDQMIWNPGDDTDLNEGGAGVDTTIVNGGGGAEVFTTTANGTRVRFDRLDPAPFSLDIGTTENLVLNANGGNDSFSATGNLAALISITVDGGAGDDTLLGSNGADVLIGGDNNDFIDGQQGNDVIFFGDGDDTFNWDPGDGSDLVEGQAGNDTLLFNGSGGAEIFEASANGSRVSFTRNLGTIVMDLNEIETIDLNTLGNTDTTIVNDLTGTDLTEININQAGTIGGNTGDAQADAVIVNGTGNGDDIDIVGSGTSVSVIGLTAQVNITNSEGANDSLVINALGGDDEVTATTLPAGIIKLTIDGGAGDDTLFGSQGADVFLGGADDDFIFGDNGNDVALMGAGNDIFQWDPGDGSDTIEGQGDVDGVIVNGSNANEVFNIVPNGGRVLLTRDVGSVTLDINDAEALAVNVIGGTDSIVVGDLTGTDLFQVNLDLAGSLGGSTGDLQADSVTVNATNSVDVLDINGNNQGGAGNLIAVVGLPYFVQITHSEGASDTFTLNALGGSDTIDAFDLEAGVVNFALNGGLGNDILIGSKGNDTIIGGDGNDLALMGPGNDTFIWNPGDDNDTLEGQGGNDTLQFNGANVSENIGVSRNGGRVTFTRDVASVVMDLDDVEVITYNALGGADTIVVNDLAGTDVVELNFHLASLIGGNTGDAQPDNVIVNGTGGDDVILVTGGPAIASVFGLPYQINITTAEAANDRLTINALGGDDVIDASAVVAGAIQLTFDGGNDSDVLTGGDGNDVLLGGDGDDVLIGGLGIDILDGGLGDDVEIQ